MGLTFVFADPRHHCLLHLCNPVSKSSQGSILLFSVIFSRRPSNTVSVKNRLLLLHYSQALLLHELLNWLESVVKVRVKLIWIDAGLELLGRWARFVAWIFRIIFIHQFLSLCEYVPHRAEDSAALVRFQLADFQHIVEFIWLLVFHLLLLFGLFSQLA